MENPLPDTKAIADTTILNATGIPRNKTMANTKIKITVIVLTSHSLTLLSSGQYYEPNVWKQAHMKQALPT